MLRLFGTLVALLLASLVAPGQATAATPGCGYTNHCRTILVSGNSSSPLYYGMRGNWNRAAMSAGCSSSFHSFMNSEMWFSQVGTGRAGFVEAGHTAGWFASVGACDYYAYTAWLAEDGSGYTEHAFYRLNSHDSVTDQFKIWPSTINQKFNVSFGSTTTLTANVQFNTARGFELGGEIVSPNSSSHLFYMQARAITSANGSSESYFPAPTGGYNNLPAYLDGSNYSNSAWSWRVKP